MFLGKGADKRRMGATPISRLARVASHGFQSFSEAADSVMDWLEQELRGGRLVLAQLEHPEDEYRIVDARGAELPQLHAGLALPLSDSFCLSMIEGRAPRLTGAAGADSVYGALELQRSLMIESYVGVPIELCDGSRVASLCAMSTAPDAFDEPDLELVTVAGRLLTYEWERVRREAELRRLTEQCRDPQTTDPVTGVANRDSFLESLDREWRLARRGTLSSYAVVCRLEGLEAATERLGDATGTLLLKCAAEALTGTARGTDVVGRLEHDLFGLVLVGCEGREGAAAFRDRFVAALGRILSQRPGLVDASLGVQALAAAASPGDALALALAQAEASLAALPRSARAAVKTRRTGRMTDLARPKAVD